ncbi:protein of unknown function [Streptococcus thermophilus]|nr:protein of unknown function [Streptococcus thermophilus]
MLIYKKLSKCITKIVFFIYNAIINPLAYLYRGIVIDQPRILQNTCKNTLWRWNRIIYL